VLCSTPHTHTHTHTHTALALRPQGDGFFAQELARLERMIGSGGVAASKVDDFARKTSVLSAFTDDGNTAEL
jgi:hypothetical protein